MPDRRSRAEAVLALAVLLAFQVAGVLTRPPDDRLLHPVPPNTCHTATAEIVVCGRSADTWRLPKPGPPPDIKGPPKAEWGLIGDAKMSAHGEQRWLGGIPAPAAMVTVTIPF